MAAHRYWRIYITAATGTPHLDISEIQMRTTAGGADQCTGGTAIYSAQTSGFEASKSFDDTTSTTWYISQTTYPLPQWIGYDFGSGVTKDIVEFTLVCWASAEMAKDFTIEYSDDASTYTTASSFTNQTGWSNGELRTFTVTASSGVAEARVSQVALEVLHAGDAKARVSQVAVEVLHAGDAKARVSQVAIEVLRSIASASAIAARRRQIIN